ncbi:RdgB/HAM1 family non-canonical purine NTP pyrophosphatase [Lewinella cohaerens]|uniref:RdgB/HAM1 family non-canonical purine NTP pyrophosphatase n=1 Tax=Lewinella cohaerens TaxID=70995 RepID=UPI00037CA6F4|nr:RdgB/HAM1 family non-canonical purine NTP pyrophosphatase [Lewinella cohaerens]
METIVFATNNPNKIREVQQLLGSNYQFLSLEEVGCQEELPETSPTLEGNALEKARYLLQNYHQDCFSEDTGLEVEALDGAPGVITARYAGAERDPDLNMQKLLRELAPFPNRKARFRTVIALLLKGEEYLFEGIVEGEISTELQGEDGFGYDPVFMPEGQSRTFAQMSKAEKNAISHRGRAIAKLQAFLEKQADHG